MEKTGLQVEHDVYTLIKSSGIKTAINGDVYKEGTRPLNSQKEDAIVIFKVGLSGQIQEGEVTVNIFVPLLQDQKNIARLRALEAIAQTAVESLSSAEYQFSLGATIQTYYEETAKQHFINIRLRYRRITI